MLHIRRSSRHPQSDERERQRERKVRMGEQEPMSRSQQTGISIPTAAITEC
jgi:hypothetical protein